MDPTCVFNFFTFFERILYKSNSIIFIFSWCATHTKIRSKLAVIVTAGSQKITLWSPQRTPLVICIRVKRLYEMNGATIKTYISILVPKSALGIWKSSVARNISVCFHVMRVLTAKCLTSAFNNGHTGRSFLILFKLWRYLLTYLLHGAESFLRS